MLRGETGDQVDQLSLHDAKYCFEEIESKSIDKGIEFEISEPYSHCNTHLVADRSEERELNEGEETKVSPLKGEVRELPRSQ